MAPINTKRLIAAQENRLREIELMRTRLKERPQDSLSKAIVKARLVTLDRIWTETREAHYDISSRDGAGDESYISEDHFSRLQALYEDTHDEFLNLLDQLKPINNTSRDWSSLDNSCESDLRIAKLPKLELPKFSGKYEEWDGFADLFVNLVHNAPGVADATKFQYLKSCLIGTAADFVKDVATTNANYGPTWTALKARFENTRLLVNNHVNALMNLPYLKRESPSELRSFTDEAQRIVRAFTNLNLPVAHWDVWLVYHVSARLDLESRKLWESELSTKDRARGTDGGSGDGTHVLNTLDRLPKFIDLSEFLEKRVQMLSMIADGRKDEKRQFPINKNNTGTRKVFHTNSGVKSNANKCPFCPEKHALYQCSKFKGKTPRERSLEARRLQLCFNCFGKHRYRECRSSVRCASCQGKHHSLLHLPASETTQKPTLSKPQLQNEIKNVDTSDHDTPTTSKTVNSFNSIITSTNHSVLLATARVVIAGPQGQHTCVRALIDQGSEATFISESVVQFLKLKKIRVNINLTGVGACSAGKVNLETQLKLKSVIDPLFKLNLNALVLPKLTSKLPVRSIVNINREIFKGIELADPQFFVRNKVEMILGADVYCQIIREGVKQLANTNLVAQNTALGWIVSGSVNSDNPRRADQINSIVVESYYCSGESELDKSLEKFWKLEELPEPLSKLNIDKTVCEKQFEETHRRERDGRYTVKLPLKKDRPSVGKESRRIAANTLTHTYRRFTHDPKLSTAYNEFMTTYEQLGHMIRIPTSEIENDNAWYLPHHAVIQQTQSGSKIRVVFDASRRTREQHCLNDFLLPGPALQHDLSLILLNWRRYRFVFTADIVKMFRQIRVAPEDQDSQRILWESDPLKPPIDYRLTTVTYGTSCAPYLAIRTLIQLACDERSRFPLGARCLEQDTYVDDTFAGSNDLSIAISKSKELIAILQSAGIELDKWAANHIELLPPNSKQNLDASKKIDSDLSVRTLGLNWNPNRDEFSFSLSDFATLAGASRKRAVLSNIARLFDPLGWLSPVTVTAKILMQDLWILKCEWDEILPINIRNEWLDYCSVDIRGINRTVVRNFTGISV